MNPEEFNVFDVGQHYLKLKEIGVPDPEIGKTLRRFVQEHASMVEDNVYGVECERVEKDS